MVTTGAERVEKQLKVEVESVKGNEEALPNEMVTYTVDSYNTSQVKESDKKSIKWAVKANGEVKPMPFLSGESIKLNMKQEWVDREILVMARYFFGKFDENISQRTKIKKCSCGGPHPLKIIGLGEIKNYTGDFPSPFQIMNYTPSSKEEPFLHQVFVPDKTIRKWIKDAAEYHEIPLEMISVILQQENAPSASKFRQFLQFGERTLTTIAAKLDNRFWDIIPNKIADGSSGFMNMRRPTLKETIKYTKEKYGRELMPTNVANRIGYFYDTKVDDGIQGADWRADLYYGAAHIRQLIDRVMGNVCSKGEITLEQVEKVFKSFNGSGAIAEKYGKDAIKLLKDAAEGKQTLYFYEK